VLSRATYAGLVGLAMFLPVEYQRYGPLDAAMFPVGPGLVMGTAIERHRVAAGKRAWMLPVLERIARRGLLRNSGRRFDRLLKPETGPFLTLEQIRDEYACQVLADARADPNLDERLVRLSEDALAMVRELESDTDRGEEPEDAYARLLLRRGLLLRMANRWIAIATDPNPPQQLAHRTYRGYSTTTMFLAAVCRLADNKRLLAS
jgi:hypothetical protein